MSEAEKNTKRCIECDAIERKTCSVENCPKTLLVTEKEACELELLVCRFFDFPYGTITDRTPVRTDFGILVGLVSQAKEKYESKSQEDNQELVEALRKITEISGTANRSAFNQIKDAVNDIQEIAETELAKHSK